MNRCFAFATLAVALVLGSAGSANAFFGLCGGSSCGCGCCEKSCACEQSCGCEKKLWLREFLLQQLLRNVAAA